MKTLATVLLMCVAASAYAQTPCDDLLKKAKSAHEKGEYAEAFAKYRAVKLCNTAKSTEMDKLIEQLFADVDNERAKAQAERDKNLRIINSLYFYEDKYGLGYKDDKYGFIDKNGEVRIDFQYDNATAFDINGYSNVITKNRKYKLDTLGNLYLYADNINEIAPDVEFIELSTPLNQIPEAIWACKNLKKLYLTNDDNEFEEISEQIKNLSSLEDLKIRGKNLKKLPMELASLSNLKNIDFYDLSKLFAPTLVTVWNDTGFVLQQDTTFCKNNIAVIQQIKNVEYLDIASSKCNATILTQLLANKPALKQLYVADNHIDTLNWLHLVPTLQVLDLRSNTIASIRTEFYKLSNLKELLLGGNNISFIDKDAFLHNKSIIKLDLSVNELQDLSLSLASVKDLDISSNKLKSIAALNTPNVSKLNISECSLSGELDINFSKFPNLKDLDLSSNKITKINCQGVSKINNLELEDNPLVAIDAKPVSFTRLETLNLSTTNLTDIPHWLGDLPQLTSLSIAELKQLTNLSAITRCKYLTALDISGTAIIKDNITMLYGLTNLQELNVSSTNLATLPNDISKLKKLLKLNLSSNELDVLPIAMRDLNLEKLNLSKNKFQQIPASILKIKTLKDLDLADNKITHTRVAASWQKLINLDLGGNSITYFSADSLLVPRLSWLRLMDNPITEFSQVFAMPNLTYLDLSGTRLAIFPYAISQCYSLQSLDFTGNKITEIPAWIQNLQNLEELELSDNLLTDLPLEISHCKAMTILILSGNPLVKFPKAIHGLMGLQKLHLDRTKLSEIPQSFDGLRGLNELEISLTPIASKSTQRILRRALPQTEIIIN